MIKIEYLDETLPVYDITVEDNHNFYANDILVHNCAEILEVVTGAEDVDPETGVAGQTAVCNLASIALPKFVKGKTKKKFDFEKLEDVVYTATVNLNKVIDVNYYPSERGRRSNQTTRPIATGIQGLADVFFMMGYAFDSTEARELNLQIAETMYYAALKASNDLSKRDGAYDLFAGSPASQGILQFDMWNVTPSKRYDWDSLKKDIVAHGLRNSLTLALMPTASTASIFGNEASAEAITSNMYTRRVLSGEFIIVNKHLVNELCELGLWDEDMRQTIIAHNGSVQNIPIIPEKVRSIYRTVWEISQKSVIDLYTDRGAFIDQTQSMNIFMSSPNFAKLTSMHFYGWGGGVTLNPNLPRGGGKPEYGTTPEKALKTGIYYLRSKAATDAIKFTVDTKYTNAVPEPKASEYSADEQMNCSLDNPDECIACGS
jgi:ribonucleotide reductase alpha subunit